MKRRSKGCLSVLEKNTAPVPKAQVWCFFYFLKQKLQFVLKKDVSLWYNLKASIKGAK
jgi:hypothetical protein